MENYHDMIIHPDLAHQLIRRFGYRLHATGEGGAAYIKDDEHVLRRDDDCEEWVLIRYVEPDPEADASIGIAPCPYCYASMETGDELPEERCCDACAAASNRVGALHNHLPSIPITGNAPDRIYQLREFAGDMDDLGSSGHLIDPTTGNGDGFRTVERVLSLILRDPHAVEALSDLIDMLNDSERHARDEASR